MITATATFFEPKNSKDGVWTLQKYIVEVGMGQPPYVGTHVFPSADARPQPLGVPISVSFVLQDMRVEGGRTKPVATLVVLPPSAK